MDERNQLSILSELREEGSVRQEFPLPYDVHKVLYSFLLLPTARDTARLCTYISDLNLLIFCIVRMVSITVP